MPVDEYDSDGDLIPDGVFDDSDQEEIKPSRSARRNWVHQEARKKEQARVLQAQSEANANFFDFEQMERYEASAVAVCEALLPDIASDECGQLSTDEPAREEHIQHAPWQPEGETQQHDAGDGICCSVGGGKATKDLSLFMKIGGTSINAVGKNEWEMLPYDLVIDSGAAETVIPLSWLASHPTQESPDSRAGAYYTAANGERIENEGQKILTLATSEGVIRKMTFQVCKSSKALGSVSKICKAGHRVVFDGDGSYIEDKTSGEVLWLVEKDGLYVLPATYAPPNWKPGESAPDFGRRGS